MRPILLVTLLTQAGVAAFSQTPDAPSFEVVSIKPAARPPGGGIRPGCIGGPGSTDPGLLNCSFVSLAEIIYTAYGLQPYQFSPADWMRSSRFEITAKIPPGTTKEQLVRMQQELLAERFKLKLHHEQKEMPTYELTVGKNGTKLKESTADAVSSLDDPGAVPKFRMSKDGFPTFPAGRGGLLGLNSHFRWTGFGLTMAEIVKTLAGQVGRPVVDATGLKGKFDIDMYWAVEPMSRSTAAIAASDGGTAGPLTADIDSGPTIIRAVQDQLGLKLDSKKGLVDIVVVDHAEKVPVEN
jgi:uncharacterized protein (TIGR03435 family)